MLSNRLLFSKAAAARILGCAAKLVNEIREFAYTVWVWVKGKRPRFVSKSAFLDEFERYRRDAGRLLHVLSTRSSYFGTVYQVTGSGAGEMVYAVEFNGARLACCCEDWHQHEGLCKHGWAVLHHHQLTSAAQLATVPVRVQPEHLRRRPETVRGVAID